MLSVKRRSRIEDATKLANQTSFCIFIAIFNKMITPLISMHNIEINGVMK